ncbi:kelch domain-containing protein 9-like [Lineus longissimus]|uniref:kelch domain-containing protein 9-like n=1 Tax=Lineus longissimus TaxID=88925 RepID=UPI002B4E1C20
MAKSKDLSTIVPVSWEFVSSSGPSLAHHTGGFVRGSWYIHGGITVRGSTSPSDQFYKFDPSEASWVEVTTHGSPALSHHSSVVLGDRYLILIGGWDGKARTSDVHMYDVEKDKWQGVATSGFPVGAGLSSFTATLLAKDEILIIGREGSLRIQRRSGNAFSLKLDLGKGIGSYREYPMGVASRSGHTATMIGKRVIVFGGRDDKLIEQHPGYSPVPDHRTANVLNSVDAKIEALKLKSVTKLPCGRKHHIGVEGHGLIFIHGGDTFDGKSRFPVGEAYLLKLKPVLSVYKLGVTEVGRAGHICMTDGEDVFIHGGVGERNAVFGDLYKLKVS